MSQTNRLIDKDRLYNLPAVLALATTSGRGELVGLTISAVKKGEIEINEGLVCELLALIANLIHDQRELQSKIDKIQDEVEYASEQAQAMLLSTGKAKRCLDNVEAILAGTDIEEDE